jgi:SAM-dependent methyltransferase
MEAWYKTWFDSPYYEMLYKHRDADEARFMIDTLVHSLSLPKGGRVLDLACGTGRHSVYLNSLGYDVVGVDLSAPRIALASAESGPHLRFVQADMRHLLDGDAASTAWSRPPFDLVLNLFTSLGYFNEQSENQQVLRNVNAVLRPAGTLVIDFLNAERVVRTLKPEEEYTVGGVHFEVRRRIEGEHVVKRIRITDGGKMLHFCESVQLLYLDDFERLLKREHLKIIRLWGDYSGAPFDADVSERLIVFAQHLS